MNILRYRIFPRILYTALAVAVFITICGDVFCQGNGTTAANFLKLGVGSRAQAMAESQTAAASDVTAMAINPAALTRITRQEVGFTHMEYIENLKYDWVGFAFPTHRLGVFGLHGAVLRTPEYATYDSNGTRLGTTNSSDMVGGFSYAVAVADYFSFGFTGKYINQTISGFTANGYAGDAGFMYLYPAKLFGGGWRMGLSAQNLGPGIKADQTANPVPSIYRAGFEYSHGFLSSPLVLAFDAIKPGDSDIYGSVGLEYHLASLFAVRGGYSTRKDTGEQWRAGGGFAFKIGGMEGSLDYAFSPLGEFTAAHRITLGFKFGSIVNESPEIRRVFDEGVALQNNGRYPDAIVKFNEVLDLNPNHREALQMIKQCNENLRKLHRVREP